jgi:hypothetical protein
VPGSRDERILTLRTVITHSFRLRPVVSGEYYVNELRHRDSDGHRMHACHESRCVETLPITFVGSDARTGDTGDAPRSRDASVDMAK